MVYNGTWVRPLMCCCSAIVIGVHRSNGAQTTAMYWNWQELPEIRGTRGVTRPPFKRSQPFPISFPLLSSPILSFSPHPTSPPLPLPLSPPPFHLPLPDPSPLLQFLSPSPPVSPSAALSALWAPLVGSGAEPQPKSNYLVHFSLKIWLLVARILIIFLRINWPNFMQIFTEN